MVVLLISMLMVSVRLLSKFRTLGITINLLEAGMLPVVAISGKYSGRV